MTVQQNDVGDWVCEHGTAMDVHCCGEGGQLYPGCHSGFLFDVESCRCLLQRQSWWVRVRCWLGIHGPVELAGLHRMHCLSCDAEFAE